MNPFDNVQGGHARVRTGDRELELRLAKPLDFAAMIEAFNRFNGGPKLGGPKLPKVKSDA